MLSNVRKRDGLKKMMKLRHSKRKLSRKIARKSGKRLRDKLIISEEERRALRLSTKFMRTGHGAERSLLLMKLASLSATKGLDILEIGVFRGGSAQLIIDSLANLPHSINLFLVDTFSGHPSTSVIDGVDGEQRVGQFHDTDFNEVASFLKSRLRKSKIRAFLVKADAMMIDCAQIPLDNQLGLVHIDTDLYSPTKKILFELADSLAPGGFFLIDDYLGGRTPGLKTAVEEFLTERSDFLFVPGIVSQCILVKSSDGRGVHIAKHYSPQTMSFSRTALNELE